MGLVLGGATELSGEHWSLRPLVKPETPKIDGGANPIDAFIRAKLVANGLTHSPTADPVDLARRLTYNFTGLPPTVEARDAFLADASPDAYEKLISKLLASPSYGEHWARHWLDVANYADTHGNDHDYIRPNAWPYRDYVINSFNSDKPYGRFLQEQIAGDTLFPGDPQATVALGFLAAGPWDHTLMVTIREDTVDHRIAKNLDRDNMVSKVMSTFQSLTVHCARCHDHKFDPISQREYYSLQAVFSGVDRADRPFDRDVNVHAQRQRLLAQKRALKNPNLDKLTSPEAQQAVAKLERRRVLEREAWKQIEATRVISTNGAAIERQQDGSWFVSGKRTDRDTYILTAQRPEMLRALRAFRLEVLPDDRLPQRGPGRWDNGNFHLTGFRAFIGTQGVEGRGEALVFARASADHNEGPTISATQAIDGNNDSHWGIHPRYGVAHEAIFELKTPAALPEDAILTVLLEHQGKTRSHGIGRFRLSASDFPSAYNTSTSLPGDLNAILDLPTERRTAEQERQLALEALRRENQIALEALPKPNLVYAVTDDFPADGNTFKPPTGPRPIHLLKRGDLAKPGEIVGPGTLSCLSRLSPTLSIADPSQESQRRAALARWLVEPENGLTWRSIINRVWAYHFGRGLSATPNDFGKMGSPPSHPELLDWLAIWFRDEAKGSLKALHRLIVSSETWKQSTFLDHGLARDPDNELQWRQNRRRLTGEQVRDSVLALGGKLDRTIGGPPAIQFVHKGNQTFMPGGNPAFLDYANFDHDSRAASRRAIYRFQFRTVPDPLLDALDCPDGSTPVPQRAVSTTTQHAFALLNDPFIIRQCQHIATRIATFSKTPTEQAQAAFELILLRDATLSEVNRFGAYIERHGLANACQLLINSNEYLHLD